MKENMKNIFGGEKVMRYVSLAAAAAVMTMGTTAIAADEFLRMDSMTPGSGPYVYTTTLATVAKEHAGIEIQVSTGKASTRAVLDAAAGKVELFVSSPAVAELMRTGTAMYKDIENAPEEFTKLRSVMNFPLGAYHIITWAESDIESLDQLKGKKVFLGPPGGAATRAMTLVMEGATGLKPGVDFEQVKYDWATAPTAFQDRQLDVLFLPTNVPSPQVEQFAQSGKIRLLSIPKSSFDTPQLQQALNAPGRTIEVIPSDTYGANQVNTTDSESLGSWSGLATHVGVDEGTIYNLTKAIFENLQTFHDTAEWMKAITLETAFNELNVPLHMGAVRYFREQGINIPDSLLPPEAK